MKIVLFNQGYKKNFYKKGQRLYAYGKAEFQYGSMQMNSPQIENLGPDAMPDTGIVPILSLGGWRFSICGARIDSKLVRSASYNG